MFERFTPAARAVLVNAQEAARANNHNFIGTEHILLGLAVDGSVLSEMLKKHGVTQEAASKEVDDIIGYGQQSPTGTIPFTNNAKLVMQLAFEEMLLLAESTIGPELLLLGLLKPAVKGCVAERVLLELRVNLDQLYRDVLQLMSEGGHTTVQSSDDGYVRGLKTIRVPRKTNEPTRDSSERPAWVEQRITELNSVLGDCGEAMALIVALRDQVLGELASLEQERSDDALTNSR